MKQDGKAAEVAEAEAAPAEASAAEAAAAEAAEAEAAETAVTMAIWFGLIDLQNKYHLWPTPFNGGSDSYTIEVATLVETTATEQKRILTPVARVLDEPYSQISPLSEVSVQARQSTYIGWNSVHPM